MFIISKIVRGRRLLQEMEEDTKENEHKKQQKKKDKEIKDLPNLEDVTPDTSASVQPSDAVTGIMNRRKTFLMLKHKNAVGNGARLPQMLLNRANMPRRTLSERSLKRSDLKVDNGKTAGKRFSTSAVTEKTVRQKTECSLPTDDSMDATHLDADGKLRRTSSMPSVCDDINRFTADGKLIRHYNYETTLSKLQKRSLRFTWHRLQTRNGGKRVETVFEEVFERLMKQMPIMREIFTTRTFLSAMSKGGVATLRDHARVTVKMIDSVIKNLDVDPKKRTDTESDLDPFQLGKVHACLRPYGFNSNFWEKLGEIMIDVVLIQEAVRDLPGAGQAWVVLTACLVDQLRAGYDGTKESVQKTSLGNPPSCPVFYGQKKSIHQDDDEHIYVNFPPEKERESPICPYSNSPKHNSKQNSPQSGSPRQHTSRQLPEEPGSPFDNRRPSFTLMVDNAVDPIR